MSLKTVSNDILLQLADVISQLTQHTYAQPLALLSGNSIGKHVRHILEFYELLIASAQTGQLNYDRRVRDLLLEQNPDEVLRRIGRIDRAIQRLDSQKVLLLEADMSETVTGQSVQIPSSVARELLYNIEHAIHHMALIQVAIRATFPDVLLPPNFGVAYSTIQYNAR